VDWAARDRALSDKPDMFKMWLFKQSLSFCATGKNMKRWFGSEHTSCLNCDMPDEDSFTDYTAGMLAGLHYIAPRLTNWYHGYSNIIQIQS
jgi:hypothetical protein